MNKIDKKKLILKIPFFGIKVVQLRSLNVKPCQKIRKNPKYSNFFKIFLFFIPTNYLLLKSKTTSFLIGFCDFERVFSKN
jgi:hypothetical protein